MYSDPSNDYTLFIIIIYFGWLIVNLDPCAPNPCQNGSCALEGEGSYVCTCDPGWTGTNCDGEYLLPRSDQREYLGIGAFFVPMLSSCHSDTVMHQSAYK